MKFRIRVVFALFALAISSCVMEDNDPISITSNTFDFAESEHGWKHGFSEYPAGPDSSALVLTYAYTEKPSSLSAGKSLMLSGKNQNPELFMYIKKQITGLRPETNYIITFNVELASNAINQASNGLVMPAAFLKVGATGLEPRSIKTTEKVVLNIDKGYEDQDGSDMKNIGNIINTEATEYSLILKNSSSRTPVPITAQTNSDGQIWLIVGTDSNFQGTTTVYYTKINVVITVSSK